MRLCLVVAFVLLPAVVCGQTWSSVIRDQASKVSEALMKNDCETLIKHTHPKVVEMVGGKEKMISVIRQGTEAMAQQGVSIEKVTFGEPSMTVEAGDEIHCLIPQVIYMKIPQGRIRTEASLLAVSRDRGKNWFFVDTANLNMENIGQVFENYNPALVIPDRKPPELMSE